MILIGMKKKKIQMTAGIFNSTLLHGTKQLNKAVMAVYIDDFEAPFGRMRMCHMIADTTEELLQMVDKIGVQRKWIQYPGTPNEHFDICLSKKKKAVEFGAKEIGMRDYAKMVHEKAGGDYIEWIRKNKK